MTLNTGIQLLWLTIVRPVLTRTCPVKLLSGLGHHAAAHFQGLDHLYVEQFIFSDPQIVHDYEVPCGMFSDRS